MKDERIQNTANRFAAIGFLIWYVLLAISLDYRVLILKQQPREIWDLLAIFCIGTLFVFIAYASRGVLGPGFKMRWLTIGIVNLIVFLALLFFMGRMHSAVDAAAVLIGYLPAMGLVIAVSYYLNRRWERKEGIEDEK